MTLTSERAAWGDGEQIEGTPFRVVVPAEAAERRLVILSAEMPVGLVVPEHCHDEADQICVVLTGRVGGRMGDREVIAEAGGVIFMPHGVPHSHWNAGDEPARVLEIYTPPGFEDVVAKSRRGAPD